MENENNFSGEEDKSAEPGSAAYSDTGYVSSYAANDSSPKRKKGTGRIALLLVLCMVVSILFGGAGGFIAANYMGSGENASSDVIMYQSVLRNVSSTSSADEPMSVSQVSETVADSVVEIRTEVSVTSSYMQQYVTEGAGSGVVLTSDGYIVTNNHVIDGASKITVTLHNKEQYDATLKATDEQTDLAILKIDAQGLSPATLGNSESLKVGEGIVVVGNPLGELGGSVSYGIVSALDREVSIGGSQMRLLQTDAAVNPGNSGGGMFNLYGELIGIVNAKGSGSDIDNIGFAIPIDSAKEVIEQLISFGYVQNRPYLGITTVDITDSFSAMQYRVSEAGVYILKVESGTNAAKAGLKSGDRLISVGGSEIEKGSDITAALSELNVGEKIEVVVSRDGEKKSFTFILEELIPADAQ